MASLALVLGTLGAVACGGAGGGAPHDAGGGAEVLLSDGAGPGDVLRITGVDLPRHELAGPDVRADAAADTAVPDGAADGGADDTGGPADAGTDVPDLPTLVLEPGTLSFFALPLGSLRYAVAGWDAHTATCVTLVWDYSNTGHPAGAWCDDLGPQFPYVLAYPDAVGRCHEWSTGTDLVTVGAHGCVDFEGATPASMDLVDVDVVVEGPSFTGRIRATNRERRYPAPVSFGLRVAPSAGPVVVQAADEWGLPGWLQLTTDDGAPVLPFDRCDRKACGETVAPACPADLLVPRTLDPAAGAAAVWATWDGRVRVDDEDDDCRRRVFAEAGAYRATFCYGTRAAADGRIADPVCRTVRFAYPTPRVDIRIE